jgi:poly(U)-binding-splicing factor PUF60
MFNHIKKNKKKEFFLGREQRHLLMQKLNQRRLDSHVCVIRNMVGPEDVDDDLQQDVTG